MKRTVPLVLCLKLLLLFVLGTYWIIIVKNNCSAGLSTSSPTYYDARATSVQLPIDMLKRWNGTFYDGPDKYIQYNTARLGLKQLFRARPIRSDFGPVIHDVTSFRFPINVPSCSDALQVFIVVISAPGYFDKRRIIRQTWGRHLDPLKVRTGFLVGKTSIGTIQRKIEVESHVYNDIIQADFIDVYDSLPLKTVAYLNWINSFCSRVPFIVKCDDDVYINVHNLATTLHTLPPNTPAIYGGYNPIEQVNRMKVAKWYVSTEVWPWQNYPPYLYGGSYLISRAAIVPLLAAAQVTPYFMFEDVYLIGVCARKAGVLVMSNDSYNPFCAIKQVTWLTSNAEEMLMSNRNFKKFYRMENYPSIKLNFSFYPYQKETTLYKLLDE